MDSFDSSTAVTGYESVAFIIVIVRMLKPVVEKYAGEEWLPVVTLIVATLWNVLFVWIAGGDVRVGIKVGLLAGVYSSGLYSYVKATGVDTKIAELLPFGKKGKES